MHEDGIGVGRSRSMEREGGELGCKGGSSAVEDEVEDWRRILRIGGGREDNVVEQSKTEGGRIMELGYR